MESGTPELDRSAVQLRVLRALGLKGRAGGETLSPATGLSAEAAGAEVAELVEGGLARELRGAFMLMPDGRERLEQLLEDERRLVDSDAIAGVYDDFTAVNADFKTLASDWQLRDGEPNLHDDQAYDESVIDRLPEIHRRVEPTLARAVELAPRLQPYGPRLSDALGKVQAGEHEWLLKPVIDSYHTIWFELHEDLIGLAGRSRVDEAASGRAE